MKRLVPRFLGIACMAVLALVMVSACGSSDSSGTTSESTNAAAETGGGSEGGGSGGETVPVTLIADNSGVAGYVGQPITDGLKLGVERINESGALNGKTVELTVKDTGTSQSTAVTQMGETVSSDAVAVFSPALSNETLAAAPIAIRAGLPVIALQSNDPEVLELGDSLYRLTATQERYNYLDVEHLQKLGIKTVAMIYDSDNPTTVATGKEFFPEKLEEAGIKVVSSQPVTSTATDMSSVVTKVMTSEPEAVGMIVLGNQNAALVQGFRNAGFDGRFFASSALETASLKPVGKLANGVFYAHDFTPAPMPYKESQEFTKAYEAKYHEAPGHYAANAYDAATYLQMVLEKAPEISREGVLKGMEEVAATSTGFDGAQGPIRFIDEGHDVSVPGVLVEYHNGEEKLLKVGDPKRQEEEESEAG